MCVSELWSVFGHGYACSSVVEAWVSQIERRTVYTVDDRRSPTRQRFNGRPHNDRGSQGIGKPRERVCRGGKLVARGNWTKICPFANQKPLPYFPNALVDGSFTLVSRCSRAVGGRLGNSRQIPHFIDRCMPDDRGNLPIFLCAQFCTRPGNSVQANACTT